MSPSAGQIHVHRAIPVILDSLDFDLSSTHGCKLLAGSVHETRPGLGGGRLEQSCRVAEFLARKVRRGGAGRRPRGFESSVAATRWWPSGSFCRGSRRTTRRSRRDIEARRRTSMFEMFYFWGEERCSWGGRERDWRLRSPYTADCERERVGARPVSPARPCSSLACFDACAGIAPRG